MAERRMFAKSVIDSDDFLDMPSDAQLLYFHLSMRADDDGFVTPKKIMRMIGASDDSLKILAAKRFIIPFESGVIVIRHWRINNFLRNDRYHKTEYKDEKDSLELVNNKYEAPESGTLVAGNPSGIPVVYQRYPQDRIGKVRIGKGNTEDSLRSSSSCTEPSTEDSVEGISIGGLSISPASGGGSDHEAVPYQKIVDTYNATCTSLPKCTTLSAKRRKAVNACWKEFGDKVYDAFRAAAESDFLSGRSGAWTSCSFDWLTRVNNMLKVIEGTYANKSGQAQIDAVRRNPMARDYTGQYDGDDWEVV